MADNVSDYQNGAVKVIVDDAERLVREERFEEALALYRDLVAQFPNDVDLLYKLSVVQLRIGELREAVALLRKVLFVNPEHLPARTNMGNSLLLLGYNDQALEAFRFVLAVDPQNRNALYGYASILIRLNQHLHARPPALQLVKLLPQSIAALTLLADSYANDTNSDRAMLNYRSALRLDSSYVPALHGLAKVLIQRRKPADARMYLEHAHNLAPREIDILLTLGTTYVLESNFERAVATFEIAHAVDNTNVSVLLHLSVAKRRLGQAYMAVKYAATATRLAPTSKEAGNTLGSALAATGESAAARDVLTATATGNSFHPKTAAKIAEIEMLAEQAQTAGQHLSEHSELLESAGKELLLEAPQAPANNTEELAEQASLPLEPAGVAVQKETAPGEYTTEPS